MRYRRRSRNFPLTRHFYFPGFTDATGGLLRESGLLAARDSAQSVAGTNVRWLGAPRGLRFLRRAS